LATGTELLINTHPVAAGLNGALKFSVKTTCALAEKMQAAAARSNVNFLFIYDKF
jgi:hypothetical protein